jgi:WD40 repeat protein
MGSGLPGAQFGVYAMVVLPGGDVLLGGDFTGGSGAPRYILARYRPSDNSWISLGSVPNGRIQSLALLPDGDVVVGGGFSWVPGGVTVGNVAVYHPSTNTWSALGTGTEVPGTVSAIAVLPDGDIVLGGDFSRAGGIAAENIVRYSPESGVWTRLGAGTNGQVLTLAVLPNGDIVAGGLFYFVNPSTSGIARFSFSTGTWAGFGVGVSGGSSWPIVYRIVALPDGDLMVGGDFFAAGGITVYGVARCNPATGTWSGVGQGAPATRVVRAITSLSANTLVIAGQFEFTDQIAVQNIAQVDLESYEWSALGSAPNGSVLATLAIPGGDLLVGGSFASIGGVPARGVARHNPVTGEWRQLGRGVRFGQSNTPGASVNAIAQLPGGDIVVGGEFSDAGSIPARHIARFDVTSGTWSALGAGVNGQVNAILTLPGGDLIVGGSFTSAGGVPASRIARYSPSTGLWSALGSGLSGAVRVLALNPAGDVLVGGEFTGGIVRYNTTSGAWSSLGTGVAGTVGCIQVLPDGDIVAGGYFQTAGGVPAVGIARFRPATSSWSSMGSGLFNGTFPGSAAALGLQDGVNLVVGGSFTVAGGVTTRSVARYNLATGTWSALSLPNSVGVGTLATLPMGDIVVGGSFFGQPPIPVRFARYVANGSAPTIAASPVAATMCIGESIELVVQAVSTIPPLYQWRKDGVELNYHVNPSAITGRLVLDRLSISDAGDYDCVITNACGSVTSDAATVTVLGTDDPACAPCNYDYNQDENVDLLDAQQMAQVFVGLLAPESNWLDGDLNGDENADLTDAQILAAFVVSGTCGV